MPLEELRKPPREFSYSYSNYDEYQQLIHQHQETGEFAPIEELAEKDIIALFNAFWTLPHVDPAKLAKPD